MVRRRTFTLCMLVALVVGLPHLADAADPCAEPQARSLVMSSGGSKGAFEAGAAYHLIVQRGCDFTEIVGNSVGALNGALLAQAAASRDPKQSLANLRAATEDVMEQWLAITSSKVVMRSRPLGRIRFALFGLESIKNFDPLGQFVRSHVSLDRLASGRELRIGTMSFNDGRYHEIIVNPNGRVDPRTTHELITASAIVPLFGKMPLIALPSAGPTPLQLADGGVRHQNPVTSYFQYCEPRSNDPAATACTALTGNNTPPHPRTQQLFVLATSPFEPRNDLRPEIDPKAFDPRTGEITDGRRIFVRMFDLMTDTTYSDELDGMLLYNDLLRWQAEVMPPPGPQSSRFPLGSFNRDAPGGRAFPYQITLITPAREDSDPANIFDVQPETQRRRLYCGCIAADERMQAQFGLASMAGGCATRVPQLTAKSGAPITWTPAVCNMPAAPPAIKRRGGR